VCQAAARGWTRTNRVSEFRVYSLFLFDLFIICLLGAAPHLVVHVSCYLDRCECVVQFVVTSTFLYMFRHVRHVRLTEMCVPHIFLAGCSLHLFLTLFVTCGYGKGALPRLAVISQTDWFLVAETECVYCAVRTEHLTFTNSMFCPHSVFMCFVLI